MRSILHGGIVIIQLQSTATFSAFVRSTRLQANMTQDELAQGVRKSRRWVHDLESGKVSPSLGAALDVAAVLGFSVTLERSERSDVLDEIFEGLG
jgi:transcriptional regulator with XRE-family HTH domain